MTQCFRDIYSGKVYTYEQLITQGLASGSPTEIAASQIWQPVPCPNGNNGALQYGALQSFFLNVPEGSRLLENIPVPIDLAAAASLIMIWKKNPKIIQSMFSKWLDTQRGIATALAQAAPGNIITAWANSHLIAMMLEHNYMIRAGGAGALVEGMNWLTAAETIRSFLGTVEVPKVLQYAVAPKETETEKLKGLAVALKTLEGL